MPRYGDRVRGQARWEIVNYVRQLQATATAKAKADSLAAAQPGGVK
jgi:hypothetical protein